MDISDFETRMEYTRGALDEESVGGDPITLFQRWLDDAIENEPLDATAMTLATATPTGRPSARIVLLRGVDERGFVFFTNYDSRKAEELKSNSHAALTFFWPTMQRQVRIEGDVVHTSREESEAYFATRPRGSQIGAWASTQSSVLASREELETQAATLIERYEGIDVPCPPNWGGFRVSADAIEFWQGRESRLHDRLKFSSQPGDVWMIERLAP